MASREASLHEITESGAPFIAIGTSTLNHRSWR